MKLRAKSAHYQKKITEKDISINFLVIFIQNISQACYQNHFQASLKKIYQANVPPKCIYGLFLISVWLSTIEVEIILF